MKKNTEKHIQVSKRHNRKPINGWPHIGLHQIILQDTLRVLSYKKAIEDNVKKNDIVLDIGCGTGIFSFFAAKKGCKKVYAVDDSAIIDNAIETAKRNNVEQYCQFSKIDIFRFKPKKKIDVLLHEQIGHFLWDENIISKVAYIRDHFLKRNGIIIPFKIDLYLAPIQYRSDFEKSLIFWSKRRYGIDFSNLRKAFIAQSFKNAMLPQRVKLKNNQGFLCKQKSVYSIDLRKEVRIPLKIAASFHLKKGSHLSGMCAYFKVHLDKKVSFSTHPAAINTHWGQIFLPCFKEKILKQDATLNFVLFPKKNFREWKFKFEIV